MINESSFRQQVDLLLRVLPYVLQDEKLALKGGTAINLFVRNMPRLSVDIDLTYLVISARETSLNNLNQILKQIAQKITQVFPTVIVQPSLSKDGYIKKLVINSGKAIIKVEPNETIRGAVFPCVSRDLCQKAQDEFEVFLSLNTLSTADLYGGKICAALDRQHPRDIFDIKILFENEGLTEEIRKAFLVYLISHNRPIHELLNPNLLNFQQIFDNEFLGLTNVPVTYQELCEVRRHLIQCLQKDLTFSERRFLLSFKETNPDWSLLGISGVEELPAIKWKIQNLQKMSTEKHLTFLEKLKEVLKM